jgi:hypothetical protein
MRRVPIAAAVSLGLAAAAAVSTVAGAETAYLQSAGPSVDSVMLAQQYAVQKGVTYAAALALMEKQARANGLSEELSGALGSDYAGMWMTASGSVNVGAMSTGMNRLLPRYS